MNLKEALLKLEAAELRDDHMPATRATYRRTVTDYARLLKAGTIDGPQAYVDFLADTRKLHSTTIRKALSPLHFFHTEVLGTELGQLKLPPPRRGRRMPSELSHADCMNLIAALERKQKLQAALLYGCGLRVEVDMIRLRLKDVRLSAGMIDIQESKGDKSRSVLIPQAIFPLLEDQVRRCKLQWEKDHAAGIICPHPRESLMRKFGRKQFGTLPWYWLFPSRVLHGGPDVKERWHSTPHALEKALKLAAGQLGICQRVHPHAFRHSYATNLLRDGVDIRTIQEQLGHEDIKTTEIYLQSVGFRGVASPMDRPATLQMAHNVIPLRVPGRHFA